MRPRKRLEEDAPRGWRRLESFLYLWGKLKPENVLGFAGPQNLVKYMVLALSKPKVKSHVKYMVLALSKPENIGKYMVLAFKRSQSLVKCMVLPHYQSQKTL